MNFAVFWTKKIQKYLKILNNFLSQNKGTSTKKCSKKYKKIQFSVQWLYNIYLRKAKSRTLSLFTKHSNINIVQNFGHIQNKSIIYRTGIYNLQSRTVTFPDQEKLLKKVDGV